MWAGEVYSACAAYVRRMHVHACMFVVPYATPTARFRPQKADAGGREGAVLDPLSPQLRNCQNMLYLSSEAAQSAS